MRSFVQIISDGLRKCAVSTSSELLYRRVLSIVDAKKPCKKQSTIFALNSCFLSIQTYTQVLITLKD